jgi:peptidoglycan/LPS O-acetylase OafA/YrhL
VWLSLGTRSVRELIRERSERLLIPLVAGVILIVPPQIHFQALDRGEHVSYVDTLGRFFDVEWSADFPVPVGGAFFETAHLWFLAYLFAFTVVLLPLFVYVRRGGGARAMDTLAARPWPWLAGAIVLVALAEASFGIEDTGGWNRWGYPIFLLAGLALGAQPALWQWLAARRRRLGRIGLALFVLLVIATPPLDDWLGDGLFGGHHPAAIAWRGVKAAAGVLLVLAIVGMLAGRLTRRSPHQARAVSARLVTYGAEAVLPVYVLHQTVAVVLAYYVVRWPIPIPVQWLALTALTVGCTLALYEALRRWRVARLLLGMRPRPPTRSAQDDGRVVPRDDRVRTELLDPRPLT